MPEAKGLKAGGKSAAAEACGAAPQACCACMEGNQPLELKAAFMPRCVPAQPLRGVLRGLAEAVPAPMCLAVIGFGVAMPRLRLPPSQAVFLELGKACPTIKLLYVTPEQLVKGARLKDALQ